MKIKKIKIKKYHRCIIIGILITFFGIAAAIQGNYLSRKLAVKQQQENLLELVKSSDKNLKNIISRIQSQIYYLTMDDEFKRGEELYIEEDKIYDLWNVLRNNSMYGSDLISAIIVTVGDNVVLSSRDDFYGEYQFYDSIGNYKMRLVKAPDNRYYLTFVFHGYYDQIQYHALMDLEELYMQIVDEDLQDINEIILYNDRLRIIISKTGGTVRAVRLIDYLYDGNSSIGGFINEHSLGEEPVSAKLEFKDIWEDMEQKYITVYPVVNTENKLFTLGVMTDYDRIFAPINSINYNLILSIVVFTAGMMLLIFGFFLMIEEQAQADKKLIELREKNIAMQELLDKTKELEHVQRLELLGTMTSGISHEFNNLLTPIMGYSIMCLEKISEGSEELSENLVEIYNASKKAKTIVKRISELARKSGTDSQVILNAADQIDKALAIVMPAKPDNVEVIKKFCTLKLSIRANETQISQILMNLFINAFHAMEENGGKLIVSTDLDADERVIINIQDTGTGIPEAVLPHIFDPFFTTKETGKGTGLGLAIVKNAVEELGGSIEVTSIPGEGACFTLKIKNESL